MKAWSKTTRICVMMALDTVFLIIELGVGYYVQSLALIADAFHMLNDIISLAVGLWAVTLAQKDSNDRYSYGWLRAEILGAFFNATFLIGLCVTIVLEAIQRFFDPPDIKSPQIVLIVGCFGLLSNLVGFWVLGGHGHSHGHGDDVEAGHSHEGEHGHAHHDEPHTAIDDESTCQEDDDVAVAIATAGLNTDAARAIGRRPESLEGGHHITFSGVRSPDQHNGRSVSRGSARSRSDTAGTRGRANSNHRRVPASIDEISIHPASFRNNIRSMIEASQTRNMEDEEQSDSDDNTAVDNKGHGSSASGAAGHGAHHEHGATETTPLIGNSKPPAQGERATDSPREHQHHHRHSSGHSHSHSHSHAHGHQRHGSAIARRARRDSHGGHHHTMPRDPAQAHGHSHGDMGMNAMILHVMGDALGNIGVIVTALVIWKTTWAYRMYADPLVSLLITVIILHSALPLTLATSKILLQATPEHIKLNDIREDIQDLDGVLSCHHIHVWQLSDTQIVASLHIEVSFPISESGGEKYMDVARRVRTCLHDYGIHSATIQPEFRLARGNSAPGSNFSTSGDGRQPWATVGGSGSGSGNTDRSGAASNADAAAALAVSMSPEMLTATALQAGRDEGGVAGYGGPSCLLDCVDDCTGKGCCSVGSRAASRTDSPPGGSSHSDHGGHHH